MILPVDTLVTLMYEVLFERTLLYLFVLLKFVLIFVINGRSRLLEITLGITVAAYRSTSFLASGVGINAW